MGADKASLTFGNETLLQRVCRLTLRAANPLVVVAAQEQQLPELPHNVRVVRDLFPDEGPVGGLLTGLRSLQATAESWSDTYFWVGSCDAPFVNELVIRHLYEQLVSTSAADAVDAIAVEHEGMLNPMAAVYRSSILPIAEQLFATGERRAMSILKRASVQTVPGSSLKPFDAELLFLRNVNTVAELQEARKLLADSRSQPES